MQVVRAAATGASIDRPPFNAQAAAYREQKLALNVSVRSNASKYPKGACDHLFGPPWPWNPIGAGDVDGNHGEVLSFTKNSSGWHIVTRPLQWACHDVICDCTFEQSAVLDGNGIKLVSTLHNHRSDKTVYPAMSQELPAVYTNGPYYRLVTYTGRKPFTNDPNLTEYNTGFRGPGAKGGAWIPGGWMGRGLGNACWFCLV